MRRRPFLFGLGGVLVGCNGRIWTESPGRDAGGVRVEVDAGPGSIDAGGPALQDAGPRPVGFDAGGIDAGSPSVDAGCPGARTVVLHDTHAQALYFDGTYGPTTGVITVDQIVAGAALELTFWHGHGGVDHRFDVSPADLAALAHGDRVTLMTTEVEGHAHMLFVDPMDERWRVSGAPDRTVTIC